MQTYSGIEHFKSPLSGSVVTIGNFDGVHFGHRQLLESVVQQAKSLNVPSVVFTFYPHPVEVLFPEKPVTRLFSMSDQHDQFKEAGIDHVVIQTFNRDFSKISPNEFMTVYIKQKLNPKTLVVGHDFSFGVDRAGNLKFLEEFCISHGIRLIVIPPFKLNETIVSSTQIRKCLMNGDVEGANSFLGRRYYFSGKVEKGQQRGGPLGFHTANIQPDVSFVPHLGVYCTETIFDSQRFFSITNIGMNPTFESDSSTAVKVETHIFNFNQIIYGKHIKVELRHFLRSERKFDNVAQLQLQIQKDIEDAKRYFHGKN